MGVKRFNWIEATLILLLGLSGSVLFHMILKADITRPINQGELRVKYSSLPYLP